MRTFHIILDEQQLRVISAALGDRVEGSYADTEVSEFDMPVAATLEEMIDDTLAQNLDPEMIYGFAI